MNEVGNPEVLEGIEGYLGIPAILDSDGVVWLVERGVHMEACVQMVMAKLGVSEPEALEAIQSERFTDLGMKGWYHVAGKEFSQYHGHREMSINSQRSRFENG